MGAFAVQQSHSDRWVAGGDIRELWAACDALQVRRDAETAR